MENKQKELVAVFCKAYRTLVEENDLAKSKYQKVRDILVGYMIENKIDKIELENGEYLGLVGDYITWRKGKLVIEDKLL